MLIPKPFVLDIVIAILLLVDLGAATCNFELEQS